MDNQKECAQIMTLPGIKSAVRGILHMVVSVYMVLIIVGMPFYYTNGYGSIGTDKYQFFYRVTFRLGMLFLVLWGIDAAISLKSSLMKKRKDGRKLSRTDMFALIYGVAVLLSWLHTDYREMTAVGSAWKGATGWYMGFTTQVMFLAVYFAVSRYWKVNKVLPALWLPTALAVFFLGYCNRFSVYPVKMEYARSSFISTIGNINWYCAYAVTVFAGILYCWWSSEEKNRWVKVLLISGCILGFGTLVTQGSNSGHLALLAVLVLLYFMSIKDGLKMQRFFMIIVLFGMACGVTNLLRIIFPGSFVYRDGITNFLTYSVVSAVIPTAGVILWALLRRMNREGTYPAAFFERLGKVGMIVAAAAVALVVIMITVNSIRPGSLGKLSESPFFRFDMRWGSSRGATYYAGLRIWSEQNILGKLIGVGPDCMAMYIHAGESQELRALIEEVFSGKVLTNAHCEWLTVLVNTGLLGLIGFGGMILSGIARMIKAGGKYPMAAACGMCVFAYTVNNLLSFQQAMATSAMFLILGIGEAWLRSGEGDVYKVND